jgi:hypothetical protein
MHGYAKMQRENSLADRMSVKSAKWPEASELVSYSWMNLAN